MKRKSLVIVSLITVLLLPASVPQWLTLTSAFGAQQSASAGFDVLGASGSQPQLSISLPARFHAPSLSGMPLSHFGGQQ